MKKASEERFCKEWKERFIGMLSVLLCVLAISMVFGGPAKVQAAQGDESDPVTVPVDNSVHTYTGGKSIWYKFVVPADGSVTITLKSSSSFNIFYMCANDTSYSNRLTYNTWRTSSYSRTMILSGGTYYLYQNTTARNTVNYSICLEYESFGVNNQSAVSMDSPMDIVVNQQVTGAMTETNQCQWYRVTLPSSGLYRIRANASYHSCNMIFCFYYSNRKGVVFDKGILGYSFNEENPVRTYNLQKGTYYIKVYTPNNFAFGKYTFTMQLVSAAEGSLAVQNYTKISLPATKTVSAGKTLTLKATVTPAGKSFSWSSSDKTVAEVDSNGKVTANKAGTAVISATADDGSCTAQCKIVVKAVVKLSRKKVTLTKGEKFKLKMEGTKAKVKWSSSKKSVAAVSSKGVVTAKSSGTATITAKVGSKRYKCKVTVKRSSGSSNSGSTSSGSGNKTCIFCSGEGRIRCHRCCGSGICTICRGSGGKFYGYMNLKWKACSSCGGYGTCSRCDGYGDRECTYCNGTGRTR